MTIYIKNVCSRKEQNTFKSGITAKGDYDFQVKTQTSNMSPTKTKYMMHLHLGDTNTKHRIQAYGKSHEIQL